MTAQVHWSMSEKTFVVQLINDRYDELYCRFKGATLGGKKRNKPGKRLLIPSIAPVSHNVLGQCVK
ncbi:hypothetical protein DPMN_135631 [Dreissena polymorpha]|uniref:Uncharacterized protein n=1 Tax=Dreissena polymorpha TaxID=45954 RepID=A0A9D4G1Y0_DREPO|nr:hypothetical protein DPMN_135631 [Dreissena polymorpha]